MYQKESINTAMNVYRGVASSAKIAFFDIGMNDPGEDLTLPFELGEYLFPPAYEGIAKSNFLLLILYCAETIEL